ncbi:MAG: peptidoglycan-binding protein [Rhodobacteraceae bacterium]|nr:peptidoglycan-binding protein [Paracoccaceae bacterium]
MTLRKKSISIAVCASLAFTPTISSAGSSEAAAAAAVLLGIGIITQQNKKKNNSGGGSRSSGSSNNAAYNAQRQQNREVQSALNAFNFPVGVVDGDLGPRSQAAIGDYQSYMGYPRTGYLDDYQRQTLVGGAQRLNAGGGNAYPQVVANEGTRGLLKAFADPGYADRTYGNQNQGQYAAQNSNQGNNGQNYGNNNQPQKLTPITPDNGGAIAPLDLTLGQTSNSMATHCELVSGLTQANQGLQLAGSISDPEQALDEQFCEARSYAMTESQSMVANARVSEEQIVGNCTAIADKMAPARFALANQDLKVVAANAQEISDQLFQGDTGTSIGYGKICLGVGYRQDNAEIALGGALLMLAAGEMPYSEIMGHHLRQGFGVNRATVASTNWYNAALVSMDQGAEPAFLPGKTVQRNNIIRHAISATQVTAQSEAAPIQTSSDAGLALPKLNLGSD